MCPGKMKNCPGKSRIVLEKSVDMRMNPEGVNSAQGKGLITKSRMVDVIIYA